MNKVKMRYKVHLNTWGSILNYLEETPIDYSKITCASYDFEGIQFIYYTSDNPELDFLSPDFARSFMKFIQTPDIYKDRKKLSDLHIELTIMYCIWEN